MRAGLTCQQGLTGIHNQRITCTAYIWVVVRRVVRVLVFKLVENRAAFSPDPVPGWHRPVQTFPKKCNFFLFKFVNIVLPKGLIIHTVIHSSTRDNRVSNNIWSSRLSSTLSSIYTVSVCRRQKDRERISLRTSSPHWSSITPPQGIDSWTNDPTGINTTSNNYSSCICEVSILCTKRGRVDDIHTVGYSRQKRCSGYLTKPARVVEVISKQSIFFLVFVSLVSLPKDLKIS